jgi:hypothetical protein
VDRRKRQIRLSMKALQAEAVEEFQARTRRAQGQGESARARRRESYEMEKDVTNEPQYTAMQIAWQEALEKSKGRSKVRRKSIKSTSEEHGKNSSTTRWKIDSPPEANQKSGRSTRPLF